MFFAAQTLPHILVGENVPAILEKKSKGMYRDKSPADKFAERMLEIQDDDGLIWYTDYVAFKMNSKNVSPQGRPRMSCVSV